MIQLLLHMIGDYLLQPNRMAIEKTSNSYIALIHAFIYTLLFTIITISPIALFIIFSTHFFIDRFRLARYVIFFKNLIMEFDIKWENCKQTGFPNNVPSWLSFMLLIIVDNTLHLTINFLAITYF